MTVSSAAAPASRNPRPPGGAESSARPAPARARAADDGRVAEWIETVRRALAAAADPLAAPEDLTGTRPTPGRGARG